MPCLLRTVGNTSPACRYGVIVSIPPRVTFGFSIEPKGRGHKVVVA